MADPAVHVLRGAQVESMHRAHVVAVDASGRTSLKHGDTRFQSFLRSAAKPFQAAAVVSTGAADDMGFTAAEIALIAGSHNGEPAHVGVASSILEKAGLTPDALKCGRHRPFHKPTAQALGDAYTSLHHNCSGKHAGMLAASVHQSWDLATYRAPEHPMQQLVLQRLATAAGMEADDVGSAVDGCGVPTYSMPLRNAARAFARLATAAADRDPGSGALGRVLESMRAEPVMVAGDDRLDTRLARATSGRVILKAGAEAFYGAALVEAGLGVAIKIEDGNPRAMGPVLGWALEKLGVLDVSMAADLAEEFLPVVRNHAGAEVGRIVCTLD